MLKMDQVHVIRHKVEREGKSQRDVAKELGISRNTIKKYLNESEPKRKERKPHLSPVMDRVAPRIDELLEEWKERTTKKQRITITRVHRQLKEEGYQVGLTTVQTYMAEKRRKQAEVFIPLIHRPGEEGQVDFFEVTVEEKGVRKKVWKFVMRLMYAGWDYVWLYERCDQVSFLDGHVRAFAYFQGCPGRLVYDNLSAAVKRIMYPARELCGRFQALVSHYLFEPCFTRVGVGHDKGGVESRGKGIRLQHLTPVPRGHSLVELSQRLLNDIERLRESKRDRTGKPVSEKIEEEQRHLHSLPPYPFDPSRLLPISINRKSTVTIEGTEYSLPSEWACLEATAYVGVDQIRIVCRGVTVIYAKKDPGEKAIRYVHYLREFTKKPQAVRQLSPELMEELGEPFQRFWNLLEESHGGREAARVMAKVLKTILDSSLEEVTQAVQALLDTDRMRLFQHAETIEESVPQTIPVPSELAGYVIEQAAAADYDYLLGGGRHE
jgi:transposase